jgi:hypothetical protein
MIKVMVFVLLFAQNHFLGMLPVVGDVSYQTMADCQKDVDSTKAKIITQVNTKMTPGMEMIADAKCVESPK